MELGKGFWLLKWDSEMSRTMREKWMLVLHRNAHKVDDPLLIRLGIPRTMKYNNNQENKVKGVTPMKKRMSMFS